MGSESSLAPGCTRRRAQLGQLVMVAEDIDVHLVDIATVSRTEVNNMFGDDSERGDE